MRKLSHGWDRPAPNFGRLTKQAWKNTKITVYQVCVLSTLLHTSQAWTTCLHQKQKLNYFYFRCLCHVLGFSWQHKITDESVLSLTNMPGIPVILRQRHIRWLGHVHRMENGLIPKDVSCKEVANVRRPRGRPKLHYINTMKK